MLLGPWAAVIAVSIALAIQALFFGDGGVLASAPTPSTWRSSCRSSATACTGCSRRNLSLTSSPARIVAGIGGYVGLNVGGPVRRRRVRPAARPSSTPPNGTPLYAPFHLVADDPGHGARPPHRRGAGGVRRSRRRRRVSPAGQRADPADQPSRCRRSPTPSSSGSGRSGGGMGSDRPRRDGGADAARPARPRRRLRRGRAGQDLELGEVRPQRRRLGSGQVHRLLEPHAAGRLRLPQRRPPGDRVSAVARWSAWPADRRSRWSSGSSPQDPRGDGSEAGPDRRSRKAAA